MKRLRSLGILALTAALPDPASAEIQEYQIRRLVYLSSSCGLESFERSETPPDVRRFKILCRNTTAYPQGLNVLCTDVDDDRSCSIETPVQRFESLELLQPRPAPGR